MASKRDYNRVIDKAARRGRVVETIAVAVQVPNKGKAQSISIAQDIGVNRARAAKRFDAKAAKAAKRKK